MGSEYKNLHYFPLGLFFLVPSTFLITYSIAVYRNHVSAILPYISETGDFAPENCIFTQMLNIASLLLGICIYIRYRQVQEFNRIYPESRVSDLLNRISAFFGTLTFVGLDLTANFQPSSAGFVHYIGAAMCFFSGTLYFCSQACISSNMAPRASSDAMTYFRTCLAILSIILTVGTIFPGVLSVQYFSGQNFKMWNPDDGGWAWHLVSVVSEWMLALTYCAYILTFTSEFRRITLSSPFITLKESGKYELEKEKSQEIVYI